MRFPRTSLVLAWLIAFAPTIEGAQPPPLLTAEDLAALHRENALWRAVRADLDVPANMELLGRLGYEAADLAWFRLKLEQVWLLPGAQGLGFLGADTRAKIEEVEREFVGLYRNTRRFEETGIRPESGPLYSKRQLNAMWRRALMRALSYEEMRDYGLARSAEARQVDRFAQGLELSPLEHRELIRLTREFGDGNNAVFALRPTMRETYEAQSEHYTAIRHLLGDERCALYLERANEDFLALCRALPDDTPATAALDLFGLRLKTAISLRQKPLSPKERQNVAGTAREEAAGILDQTVFETYLRSDHARWLFPR